ncbi:MAG TPA: methyl-accepting chemotaxis protein [Anaerovoracaceae bacterium]|nr:methyl-accepting chemotaxis protein [Anaerovoracaceae bacterium]
MWNSMSIKRKLILAFIMIGLFSTIVGVFGTGAIYNTNKNTNDIYSGHFIPATYLFNIQKNLLKMNDSFNLMLYERDILQNDKRLKIIGDLQKDNQELFNQFEEIGLSVELSNTLKKDMIAANDEMDQLAALLKASNYTGAMNLAPTYHSKINIVDKDIQKLIDEGIEIANNDLRDSQRTFLFAILSMIGISALCMFSAVAAGSFLSRKIGAPIIDLAEAADQLALGNVNVLVKTDLRDEIGHLVKAFGTMTDNIKEHANAAQNIAEGNLNFEIITQSDEDVLGNSMKSVVSTLKSLVDESREMTAAALNGDLGYRGNEELFCGGYRDIVQGFNQTLEALIVPLYTSADCLERISKGDIPDILTEDYPGDFNNIKESLNTCIHAVTAMIEDVNMLSKATIEGELHTRAEIGKHEGDFKKIVAGFNQTLDAVVNPLYVAAAYIKKIGKGEIPPRLTQTYYGEFNEIKSSINACIDGLGSLKEGNQMLGRMRMNDFTGQITQTGQGIFQEISESISEVSNHVNEIIGYVNHVAMGDLDDLESLKSIGSKSENDILIPSITMMIENLQNIAAATNELSKSAIEGQLDKRGVPEDFQGEYRKIIEGINRTLDAVIEPIEEASFVLREMSLGNLNVLMEGNYQGDHAEIKNAVNGSIKSLLNYISEIASVLSEISLGNLDVAITEDYKGNFIEIKDSLNHIILSLTSVMGDISEASDHVASGSSQMLDGSHALSQGSMEQACSIEELSASIAETAEHLKSSSIKAADACGIATSAQDYARKGNDQVESMLDSMEKINDSSLSISKIIKVIDDIAFQTNILALNAAVEAARAGQHGKGFAVVADEVRNLAAKSAEAAKRTSVIIDESIHAVQMGAEIALDTAKVFHEILEAVETVTDLVVNINESAGEQASSIVIINQGIEQVSQVIQKNTAMAEQSAAMSEKLYGQAELLMSMVANYKYRERLDLLEMPAQIKLLESVDSYDMLCS